MERAAAVEGTAQRVDDSGSQVLGGLVRMQWLDASPGSSNLMAGQVTVRDAKTGGVRFQVPHGPYVLSVAFSPDGRRIASGSHDGTIIRKDNIFTHYLPWGAIYQVNPGDSRLSG